MRVISDVIYKKDLKMDLYLPDRAGFDTVLYFHGGALETGSRADCVNWMEGAIEKGLGFVSADYRMYPGARFPDYLLDAADAAAYLLRLIGDHGGSGRIILSGSSAGAYIVMMLTMDPGYFQGAGVDEHRIIACLSDSAQLCTHFNVLRERGLDNRGLRIDEAAPMFFTDRRRLPYPVMLIAYEEDIPCRPEENALFFKNIKRFDPDARIDFEILPGKHCSGCDRRSGEEQEYPCIRLMTKLLRGAG